MPDLHGWISQQIDQTEAQARAASEWGTTWFHDDFVHEIRDDGNGNTIANVYRPEYAAHIVSQAPAAVLRRCAADRKILEAHAYTGGTYEPYACIGCGSDDMGAHVEHCNDCETLQALAEGYGITADELAQLDRPVPPPRAAVTGDVIAESIRNLYAAVVEAGLAVTTPPPLTPLERALEILGPHLQDQPLYREEAQT